MILNYPQTHLCYLMALTILVGGCENAEDNSRTSSGSKIDEFKTMTGRRTNFHDAESLISMIHEMTKMSRQNQIKASNELRDTLSKSTPEEISELLNLIDINDTMYEFFVFTAMFYLADKDAKYYIDHAIKLNKDSKLLQLNSVLRKVIQTDPNFVSSWLQQNNFPNESSFILASSILSNFVEIDPETSITLLKGMSFDNRSSLISRGYQLWGREDPDAALKHLHNFFDEEELHSLSIEIIKGASYTDPSKAFSLVQLYNIQNPETYGDIFSKWLAMDPIKAGEAFMEMSPGNISLTLIHTPDVLSKIIDYDEKIALKVMSGLQIDRSNKFLFDLLVTRLNSRDPKISIEWLEQFPSDSLRDDLLQSSYNRWGSYDSDNAKRAVMALQGDGRSAAIRGLASALTRKDLNEAVAFMKNIPIGEQGAYLAQVLDSSHFRTSAKLLVSINLPRHVSESPQIRQKITYIGEAFANSKSFDNGKGWIYSLDASHQPIAMEGFVSAWMKTDPTKAAEWLQEIEPGSVRNAGIRALIDEIQTTDTEAALMWESLLFNE